MTTTALLIVDHGSKVQAANEMLSEVASLLHSMAPNLTVHAAHMELCEPSIAQGIAQCVASGATEIIVFPYMLSPGRHATEDIPRMSKEAAAHYPGVTVRVTDPFGVHEKLVEIILERAQAKP
jgi:sirohydrochlorin ferrochelatase